MDAEQKETVGQRNARLKLQLLRELRINPNVTRSELAAKLGLKENYSFGVVFTAARDQMTPGRRSVMNPEDLEKLRAAQRAHARERGLHRYGIADSSVYDDVCRRVRVRRQQLAAGAKNDVSAGILHVVDQDERRSVWRAYVIDEWIWLVFDSLTNQVATFLPPRVKHVKGYNVEAFSV